jgi:hypothetical protein
MILPEEFKGSIWALLQIKEACDFYKETFGVNLNGIWPSEGSVCPEIIPILANNKIKWVASSEDNLLQSTSIDDKYIETLINAFPLIDDKKISRENLYGFYEAQYQDSKINIIFRDRILSDQIGFVYYKHETKKAVEDLYQRIKIIGKNYKGPNSPLISIILDGENPWEYYSNSGIDFLREFYSKISSDNEIVTTKISDFINENKPIGIIKNLHSGSWIGADFKIWIGGKATNAAWYYLKRVEEFLSEKMKTFTTINENVIKTFLMAQASDWFWWYSDYFSTDNDNVFDSIFRNHLKNVFKFLGSPVPEFLNFPIEKITKPLEIRYPTSFITPSIDGEFGNYYEWFGSGVYDARINLSTMAKGGHIFSQILFGFDLDNLFLGFDLSNLIFLQSGILCEIYFPGKTEYKIIFDLKEETKNYFVYKSANGIDFTKIGEFNFVKIKTIVEIKIPFNILDIKKNEQIKFSVNVIKDNFIIENYPQGNYIKLNSPDEDFEKKMWIV